MFFTSHPQLMNILSLDDKLWRPNVCHKVFSHRAEQSAACGCGECEFALLCSSQADKEPEPGPSATLGHTKHLVTDPSGCMITLHWLHVCGTPGWLHGVFLLPTYCTPPEFHRSPVLTSKTRLCAQLQTTVCLIVCGRNPQSTSLS